MVALGYRVEVLYISAQKSRSGRGIEKLKIVFTSRVEVSRGRTTFVRGSPSPPPPPPPPHPLEDGFDAVGVRGCGASTGVLTNFTRNGFIKEHTSGLSKAGVYPPT